MSEEIRAISQILSAIARCRRRLGQHCDELRHGADVKQVTHWFDLQDLGEGFRVQSFVDAEFMDGNAISWCVELTGTAGILSVEADVRRIHSRGQDVVSQVENIDYSSVADCALAIDEVIERLCAVRPPPGQSVE